MGSITLTITGLSIKEITEDLETLSRRFSGSVGKDAAPSDPLTEDFEIDPSLADVARISTLAVPRKRRVKKGDADAGGGAQGLAAAASGDDADGPAADGPEDAGSAGADGATALGAAEGVLGVEDGTGSGGEADADPGTAEARGEDGGAGGEAQSAVGEESERQEAGSGGEGPGGEAETEAQAGTGEVSPPSLEDVTAAGKALARAKGFDAVTTIFANYGISRVSEISEDLRADLLSDLEGALA